MTVGRPDTLTFKWLSGLLVTVVLGFLAFWAKDLSGQVQDMSDQITVQGAALSNIQGELPQINARLKRIEDNQDAVARNLANRDRTR